MQPEIEIFRSNMSRAESLIGLYLSLRQQTTVVLDLTDVLRAVLVMAVSALDQLVHDLTRGGMLEILEGKRVATPAYLRFGVPLSKISAVSNAATARSTLEIEIRERHGHLSFQQPDKIADALRHIAAEGLWEAIALSLLKDAKALKKELGLLIDRRNKITHEADVDPSYPGQRWPITPDDASRACLLVRDIAEAAFLYVCPATSPQTVT